MEYTLIANVSSLQQFDCKKIENLFHKLSTTLGIITINLLKSMPSFLNVMFKKRGIMFGKLIWSKVSIRHGDMLLGSLYINKHEVYHDSCF